MAASNKKGILKRGKKMVTGKTITKKESFLLLLPMIKERQSKQKIQVLSRIL